MVVTNIRIVWFATTNVMYNVSIPYLQIQDCRIRNSRFGPALVVGTSAVVSWKSCPFLKEFVKIVYSQYYSKFQIIPNLVQA